MPQFTAHIYKPYEDAGDRYEEWDVEADSKEAALNILRNPADGCYFPELGDRLLSLLGEDDDEKEEA